MRLCITTQLTVFYEVPEDNEDSIVCELCDNIEGGIRRMFGEGLFTGDKDAECLTWEVAFRTEFVALLPAAEHLDDIRADLQSLGHGMIPRDEAGILRWGADQSLVDANGMYDPSEAARQYARNIMETGL